jgi:hypothetical protein
MIRHSSPYILAICINCRFRKGQAQERYPSGIEFEDEMRESQDFEALLL